MKRLLPTLLLAALAAAPARASASEEPALARPPKLKELVAARVPDGTAFPAPEVEVVLELDVGADGKVAEVRLGAGAGEPFDSAALEAARAFEFEPALLTTGEAVPVTVSFRMRIQAPAAPPPVVYRGLLLQRGSRRALGNVEISAVADGKVVGRALTDETGRFELASPAATFSLRGVAPGHERLEASVVAVPGEQRDETLYLEASGSGFETVVRAAPVRREVTRQVIPREVVERAAGTQGDTLKVVQNLPGVARSSFGGGSLLLRGAGPGDSRVFLEGQEIPLLYHFGGIRSTFNGALLDSVEFFPGNFAPDYGRAIGGVVDVRVRDPADDMFRGQLDLNLYDGGFNLEGPAAKDWTLAGAFHRSWIDTFLPAVVPADAPLTFQTAPRYYDYQLMATWRPEPKRRLRILAYGSNDKLELLFERPTSDPQVRGALSTNLSFHALQLAYRSELLPGLVQDTSTQITLQQIGTQIGPGYFFDLGVRRAALRSTLSRELTPWLGARAGLDLRLDGVAIALNSPRQPREGESPVPVSVQQTVGVEKRSTLYQPAAFAELRLRPLERLELLPSLRFDWYRELSRGSFDPRFAARYTVREGTVLAGGVGLFQQPPAPDEADPDTGNPELLPERSLQASVGIEQRIADGFDVAVGGFYKRLDRLVVRNPAAYVDAGAVPYTSDGSGRIYGAELQLKLRVSDQFLGWIAYTYQRSFRTDGVGREERLFDFDQPHILTALGTWSLGAGWSAGARFRLVSGNPTTPVAGSVFDASSDTWVPVYGRANSERLPAFHQLDLRVDKTWTFDTWRLGAYLDVQNVYNRANPEGWRYSFDYRERQPLTGLPILPTAGIRGDW